jgi:hypothetical protein
MLRTGRKILSIVLVASFSAALARAELSIPFSKSPASPSVPVVVLIPDAHDSLVAQEKIARTVLGLARRKGFHLVLEEGNRGAVDTGRVFWFGGRWLQGRLARKFLEERKISGPEYARILDPRAFRLYGAEDGRLYERNVRVKEELGSYERAARNELEEIRRAMRARVRRVFSKRLHDYEERADRFWRGLGPAPFGVKENFPAASPWSLWKRLEKLDRAEKKRLAANPVEQDLLRRWEFLKILENVVRLEATPADVRTFLRGRRLASELVRESPLLRYFFARAAEFYHLAQTRDKALAKNTLKIMTRLQAKKAVLVTGGFHLSGIRTALRAAGVRCVVENPFPKFPGMTLRPPNLFNLPADRARLLANLRAMDLVGDEDTSLYQMLARDARRLWAHGSRGESRVLEAELLRGDFEHGSVVVVGFEELSRPATARVWIQAMASALARRRLQFVIALASQAEVRTVRELLREEVPESLVREKLIVLRLLTPQDIGFLGRILHGKRVYFLGDVWTERRLILSGFSFENGGPLSFGRQASGRERLFRDLEALQQIYRSVLTSA